MKVDYDEFQAHIARLKRERWAGILAGETPGRVPGRRPRDPEKERILAEMDRARLAREGMLPVGEPNGPALGTTDRSRTADVPSTGALPGSAG